MTDDKDRWPGKGEIGARDFLRQRFADTHVAVVRAVALRTPIESVLNNYSPATGVRSGAGVVTSDS